MRAGLLLLIGIVACSGRGENKPAETAPAAELQPQPAPEPTPAPAPAPESDPPPDPLRSAQVVERLLRRQAAAIMACYDDALRADPSLPAGKLTASFVVVASGEVSSSTASGISPAVSTCVAGVIEKIQFPVSEDAEDLVVNYPFTFRKTPKP